MNTEMETMYESLGISKKVLEFGAQIEEHLKERFEEIDKRAEFNQMKVIKAMQDNRVSDIHFAATTGYGYNDLGRDTLEAVYASAFHGESALVRPQLTCGTHALAIALASNLRPGDELLSPVGKPYDTLEEVIGIRPSKGSLAEYGITYRQVDLLNNRDGLALGICNGFQALIKLGLVPEGKIVEQNAKSPTLTTNRIGRHISKVAYTRIASNLSPWFNNVHVDDIFSIPVSHGEGRFVADEDVIQKLFENGQVATQYVDLNGDPTMNEEFNPNGSYHAIEGITSPDGRVLGKMGHSERRDSYVGINIYGQKDQKIFESGVEYFK